MAVVKANAVNCGVWEFRMLSCSVSIVLAKEVA